MIDVSVKCICMMGHLNSTVRMLIIERRNKTTVSKCFIMTMKMGKMNFFFFLNFIYYLYIYIYYYKITCPRY